MEENSKLPNIKIEVKNAESLKDGLTDIKGNPLPKMGIVIKRVTHCSPPITEYIVPESNDYYNYLTEKLNSVNMDDFLEKAKKEI